MHPKSSRLVAASTVASAALALVGCQQYQPKPLDLAAHEADWRMRTPAGEAVRSFAHRLSERAGDTSDAFDPTDGLSLAEGELVALVFNPDLRLARLRAGVSAASVQHAGRWDDPQFSIDVLRITQSVPDRWVITPGLAFTIPISGRLRAEKARAAAAAHAALDRVAEAEWRIRRDVRLAWLEWSAATTRVDEQQRLIESMESLVASTERLADAGEMQRTEATLFSLERSQRIYELVRTRGRAAEGEQRLRSLLGLAPDAALNLIPTLAIDGENASPPDGVLASQSLTLARLQQEYGVAEQTLRREIRKQYPDLTIGPLYESDQGQSRIGFLGAIPIPILNANRQAIAEAEAERELARAAYETEYERIVGAIAVTSARAQALARERSLITSEMAPLVDRQVADAMRLLELGETGGLILLESLGRAHETKMHLIDVRLDEARAQAELAHLIGPGPEPGAPEADSAIPAAGGEVNP